MATEGKDWHKVAVHCTKLANLSMEANKPVLARRMRCASLAAALHHGGEGWNTIRKLLPDFDAELQLILEQTRL